MYHISEHSIFIYVFKTYLKFFTGLQREKCLPPLIFPPVIFHALCVFRSALCGWRLSRDVSQEVHLMLIQPDSHRQGMHGHSPVHDGQGDAGEVHNASAHPAHTGYHVTTIQQHWNSGALLSASWFHWEEEGALLDPLYCCVYNIGNSFGPFPLHPEHCRC